MLICFLASTLVLNCWAQSSRLDDPAYLKGYFRGNSNVVDYSGNGNDGTWSGTAGYATSPWGQSVLNLNGSSNYVDYGTPSDLTGTTISVCAWLNPDSFASHEPIVSYGDMAAFTGYKILITSDSDYYMASASSGSKSNSNTGVDGEVGRWDFVVAIFDDTTYHFYLNGQHKYSSAPGKRAISASSSSFKIGRTGDDWGGYFDGKIGEVRIYNIALTDEEIKQLYQMNLPRY